MLKSTILKRTEDKFPRLNADICEGLAVKQSKDIEQYIDEVLRCASVDFPEGLRYTGNYRRATPEEQLREITRLRRGKRLYEIANTDTFLCAYDFEFNGRKLKPRYLQLPYIRRGGIVSIRGSSFTVSPVISDNIFSIGPDEIYMPVTRSKLRFYKLSHAYLCDKAVVSEDVVYSSIYNLRRGETKAKRESTLMHYILAKHGLQYTFEHFFKAHIMVGMGEFDESSHPAEDWVICESRRIRPQQRGFNNYKGTTLQIAVPRPEFTHEVSSAIAGLFYIADHEPDMIKSQHLNNPQFWRRLLVRFIKSTIGPEMKAMEEMDAHIDSVDSYLDDIVKRRLVREGVFVETFYHLLAYLMAAFSKMTTESDPANLSNKYIETIGPLLYDIVYGISNTVFDLVKLTGDRLTEKRIDQAFYKHLQSDLITRINNGHGEINTLESATDCFPYSITRNAVLQSKARERKSSSLGKEMKNPSYALHASQALVNTYLFITKSSPSARDTINPFLELDKDYRVVVPESDKEYLLKLQSQLEIKAST